MPPTTTFQSRWCPISSEKCERVWKLQFTYQCVALARPGSARITGSPDFQESLPCTSKAEIPCSETLDRIRTCCYRPFLSKVRHEISHTLSTSLPPFWLLPSTYPVRPRMYVSLGFRLTRQNAAAISKCSDVVFCCSGM